MVRQLITMRMGVGIMTGSPRRFCLRMMGRVGIRMIHGVMVFLLIVAFLVLSGL